MQSLKCSRVSGEEREISGPRHQESWRFVRRKPIVSVFTFVTTNRIRLLPLFIPLLTHCRIDFFWVGRRKILARTQRDQTGVLYPDMGNGFSSKNPKNLLRTPHFDWELELEGSLVLLPVRGSRSFSLILPNFHALLKIMRVLRNPLIAVAEWE